MSAAPRKQGNRDLPEYLNASPRNAGGRKIIYFYYSPPWLPKSVSFGTDRKAAISAAKVCNAEKRTVKDQELINRAQGGEILNDFLTQFRESILPALQLAEKTKKEHLNRLTHIEKNLGPWPTSQISLKKINEFLDGFPPVQSNRYHTLLCLIWKHGKSKGIQFSSSPMDAIRKPEEKKREPLTLDGFRAIYENADTHHRNAMDIAIQTLLRREDIANLKMKDWDKKAGTLTVVPQKQKRKLKTKRGIIFKVGPPLQAVLERCISDSKKILSPWLIHQPASMPKNRRGKKLSPESLSRGFAGARKKSRFYADLDEPEDANPPTFHEMRALGGVLYHKQGKTDEEIMRILGHSDGRISGVTLKYLDNRKIYFETVEVGLDIQPLTKIAAAI